MMFTHILRLESVKQRHLAFSLVVILAGTLFLTLLRQMVAQQAILEGLAGIFVLLSIGGIPLVAALLGGLAGAALRATSTRMVEEALPFHPRSMFLSAYLISLIHFVLIAIPVLAAAYLTGAISGIDALMDFRWREQVLILLVLQLHALAFSLSYVSKMATVGVASAIAVCGLQLSLFITQSGSGYRPYWLGVDYTMVVFYSAAAFSPFLFAATVAFLAKHLQREGRPAITMTLLLVLLLFGGSFALGGFSLYEKRRFETELNPAFILSRWYSPEKENTLRHGAVFSTASGKLVRVTAAGEKIWLGKQMYAYGKVTYGTDNKIWVLSSEDAKGSFAVRYESASLLQNFTKFTSPDVEIDQILVRDEKVYLFGTISGNRQVYALLTQPNEQPVWQNNTWKAHYMERSFEPLIESGEAAYPFGDRKLLFRKLQDGSIQQWALPGVAVEDIMPFRQNFYTSVYSTNKGPEFFLSVLDSQSKQRLVVCHADGTVSEPWPSLRLEQSTKIRVHKIPGGGAAAVEYPGGTLYILDSNGNAFQPLKIARIFSKEPADTFVQAKRLSGHQLWVIINSSEFIKFDLRAGSHKVFAEVDDTSWLSLNSAEEGIYFTRGGKIRLLDWDGNERVVTSSMLD